MVLFCKSKSLKSIGVALCRDRGARNTEEESQMHIAEAVATRRSIRAEAKIENKLPAVPAAPAGS
jgi:hypothetical protein